jgi:hypothetical protein
MTTVAPRTRPGKQFPGGRTMRRVLTRLTERQRSATAKGKHTHKLAGSRQP